MHNGESRRRMSFYRLIKQTTKEWIKNDVSIYAASISYYTLFSIGPMITIVIWLLGIIFKQEAVDGQVYALLQNMVNESVAKLVQEMVIKAGEQTRQGLWATSLGLVITLYSAASIVVQMKEVLDKIWHRKHEHNKATLAKKYLLGLAGIFGIGLILLMSGLMSALVSVLGQTFFVILPFTKMIVRLANHVVVFISISLFLAAMFKYLPNMRLRWKAVIPGALFTTTLFLIGKVIFGWYMATQTLGSMYGAASSFVVFIMWVYFSAQIIFYGAEFTQVYAADRNLILGHPQVAPHKV